MQDLIYGGYLFIRLKYIPENFINRESGRIKKVAPRFYTSKMADSAESLVKRNLIDILALRKLTQSKEPDTSPFVGLAYCGNFPPVSYNLNGLLVFCIRVGVVDLPRQRRSSISFKACSKGIGSLLRVLARS